MCPWESRRLSLVLPGTTALPDGPQQRQQHPETRQRCQETRQQCQETQQLSASSRGYAEPIDSLDLALAMASGKEKGKAVMAAH